MALAWLCASQAAGAQAVSEPSSLERTVPKLERDRTVVAPSVSAPQQRGGNQAHFAGTFVLGAVDVEGATAFTSAELSQDFEPLLASAVGESQLGEIADRITKRYKTAGYLLSYAVIPEQSVQSGIVRVNVVEGYIGAVRIEGAGRNEASLKAMADALLKDRPLRADTLERVLGLMRDVPGLAVTDVRISRAPEAPDRHDLVVVFSNDRTRALFYSDNRGTVDGARVRLYSSVNLASLVTTGDQLQLDLFGIPGNGYRFIYGQGTASVPLGNDGWRLGGSLSLSDQHQRLPGQTLDGTSRNVAVQLSYPILKSRVLSATGRIAINDWHSEDELGGILAQRDRLRVGRLSFDITSADVTRIDAQLSISHSLGFSDGTKLGDPLASRPDAGSHFSKVNIDIQMARPLSEQVTLRVNASGQYSSRPLLSVEEFALGGSRIGRAYDFNALTGDHGFGGAFELGYKLGDTKAGLKRVELFGYVDGGAVIQSGDASGLPKSRGLVGLGGGARFSLMGMIFSAELGVPLEAANTDRSIRGFASIARAF